MKIIVRRDDESAMIRAIDEFEDAAMKILGDEFGYNKEHETNVFAIKSVLPSIIDSLIFTSQYSVASELLRFVAIIVTHESWMVMP